MKRKLETARDELARLVSERIGTRAELSHPIEIKNETRAEAESVLADIREHLYANLPGKKDTRLRQSGYRLSEAAAPRPENRHGLGHRVIRIPPKPGRASPAGVSVGGNHRRS